MTSPHPYGPHQPEHAPNAVTVLAGGRRTGSPIRTEVHPMPPELARQRELRNQLAHYQAILATVAEPCRCPMRRHTGECAACGVRHG